ncbi:MAG: hypothetical protein ACREDT_08095, partial [Methylocella sp.]
RGGMIDNRSHRGAGASPQTKSRTGTEQSQSVILQSSLIEASRWRSKVHISIEDANGVDAGVGQVEKQNMRSGGISFVAGAILVARAA